MLLKIAEALERELYYFLPPEAKLGGSPDPAQDIVVRIKELLDEPRD